MSRARSVADLGNQNVLDLNANDGTLKVGAGVTIENTGEVQFAGIVTAATVQVGAATTLHSTGLDLGSGTLTCHNITSTGVLTYEDVTSVDSIGIITARSGIDVGTGTSISSPSSNVLTLGTSGSEKLRIDSSGRMLIGALSSANVTRLGQALAVVTTSDFGGASLTGFTGSTNYEGPILDIQRSRGTSTVGTIVEDNDRIGSIVFRADDGTDFADAAYILGEVDGTPSGGYVPGRFAFYTSTNSVGPTERMRIDSSGNMGLGNQNPAAGKLVITASSNGGFGGSIVLENSNNSDTDKVAIAFRPNGSATTVIGSYGEARIIGEYDSGSTNGSNNLQFWTHAGNGTVNERMRIDSAGNVGIGLITTSPLVTAPLTNLQVNGANVSSPVAARNAATPPSNLHVSTNGYGIDQGGSISLGSQPDNVNYYAAYASIAGRRSSSLGYIYSGYLQFNTSDGTNLNERMRIDSSGNMGLGISNPAAGASGGSNRILNIASGTSSGVSHITFGDSNAVGKIESVNGNGTIAINATTAVTIGTSGSSTERMRIDSNGDHFINTGVSNYGGSLFIGANASPSGNLCAFRDSNKRPLIYLGGAYPEITFAHTETGNARHGSIIRFANYVASTNTAVGSQFVLGTNGQGTFFEIGYANAGQNINSHHGFDDYPDYNPDGNQGIRIDNSGRVVKKNQPGFLARRTVSGDGRAAGAQEWAVSGTASFNTGNHFNTSNGRFTAPVAGRYLFIAQPGYKQSSFDYNFYFYVNGTIASEVIRFIDGGDDLVSHSAAGGSVVYNLAANDYVYVYVNQTHHANTTYNYFCGYLLG
nr:putative endosialidase [uncultured Mediterranean phage uvMED]